MFIAISLDGFIARLDGSLEWLTDPPSDIDHAAVASDRHALDWAAFLPSVDHLVMGRGTYEKVLEFDIWPYEAQSVLLLSTTAHEPFDRPVTVARSVTETVELLAERGARSVYVDGGRTVQAFLAADLIDELTVSVAPVLLGAGIPLFDTLPREVRLRLRAAHASPGGMTHATYDVVR